MHHTSQITKWVIPAPNSNDITRTDFQNFLNRFGPFSHSIINVSAGIFACRYARSLSVVVVGVNIEFWPQTHFRVDFIFTPTQ